jgi:hypothetical protein
MRILQLSREKELRQVGTMKSEGKSVENLHNFERQERRDKLKRSESFSTAHPAIKTINSLQNEWHKNFAH